MLAGGLHGLRPPRPPDAAWASVTPEDVAEVARQGSSSAPASELQARRHAEAAPGRAVRQAQRAALALVASTADPREPRCSTGGRRALRPQQAPLALLRPRRPTPCSAKSPEVINAAADFFDSAEPRAAGQGARVHEQARPSQLTPASASGAALASRPMHRVLLIDDDEHLAAPLATYLRRFDFELEAALRGPAPGLARLRSREPSTR